MYMGGYDDFCFIPLITICGCPVVPKTLSKGS